MTYDIKIIEKVYKDKNISLPFADFLSGLQHELAIEQERILTEKKERESRLEGYHNHPDLDETLGGTLSLPITAYEDFITKEVKAYREWYDTFMQDGGLPDGGVNKIEYFKVGNKIFAVKLHCESQWVGDWSVRQNLPGRVSVVSIKEIVDYELLVDKGDFFIFKIK